MLHKLKYFVWLPHLLINSILAIKISMALLIFTSFAHSMGVILSTGIYQIDFLLNIIALFTVFYYSYKYLPINTPSFFNSRSLFELKFLVIICLLTSTFVLPPYSDYLRNNLGFSFFNVSRWLLMVSVIIFIYDDFRRDYLLRYVREYDGWESSINNSITPFYESENMFFRRINFQRYFYVLLILIFNPFLPLSLERDIWRFIDVFASLFLILILLYDLKYGVCLDHIYFFLKTSIEKDNKIVHKQALFVCIEYCSGFINLPSIKYNAGYPLFSIFWLKEEKLLFDLKDYSRVEDYYFANRDTTYSFIK